MWLLNHSCSFCDILIKKSSALLSYCFFFLVLHYYLTKINWKLKEIFSYDTEYIIIQLNYFVKLLNAFNSLSYLVTEAPTWHLLSLKSFFVFYSFKQFYLFFFHITAFRNRLNGDVCDGMLCEMQVKFRYSRFEASHLRKQIMTWANSPLVSHWTTYSASLKDERQIKEIKRHGETPPLRAVTLDLHLLGQTLSNRLLILLSRRTMCLASGRHADFLPGSPLPTIVRSAPWYHLI